MSVDPTTQHHHKRIARVTHSNLAAPCEQGGQLLLGDRGVVFHDTLTERVRDVLLKGIWRPSS